MTDGYEGSTLRHQREMALLCVMEAFRSTRGHTVKGSFDASELGKVEDLSKVVSIAFHRE